MASINNLSDPEIKSAWRGIGHGDPPKKLSDGGGMYLLLNPRKPQSKAPAPAYWRLKYRVAGVEKSLSLGVYPETSLAKARERREAARRLVQEGKDPSRERKAARATRSAAMKNTFRAVAEEWLALHPKWVPGYRRTIVSRLELHVYPEIADEPVNQIMGHRMLEVIRKIEARGIAETAHRVRQDVDRIFRHAIRTYRCDTNPAPHPEVLLPRDTQPFASIKNPAGLGGLLRAIHGYHGYGAARVDALAVSCFSALVKCAWRRGMSSTSRTASGSLRRGG